MLLGGRGGPGNGVKCNGAHAQLPKWRAVTEMTEASMITAILQLGSCWNADSDSGKEVGFLQKVLNAGSK